MEPGRCSIHGLILAEDGKCVICRRGADAPDEPRRMVSEPVWAIVFGGVILIGAGAWLVFADPFSTKPRPAGEKVVLLNHSAPTTPEIPEAPPPPRRTTVFVNLDPPATSASAAVADPDETPTGPSDAEMQAAMRQVRIVMYSAGSDPFCEQVRTFLRKRKYTFTEYDVEKSETDKIEMQALDRSGTLPVLNVEGTVLVGFDRQEFEATVRRIAEARLKSRRR